MREREKRAEAASREEYAVNTNEAADILEMLMDGVDPITGEILPAEHVCQEPAVSQALLRAVALLRSQPEETVQPRTRKKRNAGRPWTMDETMELKRLFEAGASVHELCSLLERRPRGIDKQLQYLGLLPKEEHSTPAGHPAAAGAEKANSYWTYQEDCSLWEMNRQNKTIGEMAHALQRSEYAIFCRLERWGLTGGGSNPTCDMYPNWKQADTELLNHMLENGSDVETIADMLARTPEMINARIRFMRHERSTEP